MSFSSHKLIKYTAMLLVIIVVGCVILDEPIQRLHVERIAKKYITWLHSDEKKIDTINKINDMIVDSRKNEAYIFSIYGFRENAREKGIIKVNIDHATSRQSEQMPFAESQFYSPTMLQLIESLLCSGSEEVQHMSFLYNRIYCTSYSYYNIIISKNDDTDNWFVNVTDNKNRRVYAY